MVDPNSKTTQDAIQRRLKAGESYSKIATSMGVSFYTVRKSALEANIRAIGRFSLSQASRDEVRRRVEAGESQSSIRRATGLSLSSIRKYGTKMPRTLNQEEASQKLQLPLEIREEILRRFTAGESKMSIARTMGLSTGSVTRYTPRIQLTDQQVGEIRRLVESGVPPLVVAKQFSRSEELVKMYAGTVKSQNQRDVALTDEVKCRVRKGEQYITISRELNIPESEVKQIAKKVYRNFEVSDELKAAIRTGRKDGQKLSALAAKLGVPGRIVKEVLGVNITRFTAEQREEAIRAAESGEPIQIIAERTGISSSSIYLWFKDAVEQGKAQRPLKSVSKSDDFEFTWITRVDPELEEWRQLTLEWTRAERPNFYLLMSTMTVFIDKYIIELNLPRNPRDLLRRGQVLPDFFATACPNSGRGKEYVKMLYQFVEWILDSPGFAEIDESGVVRLSNLYANPFNHGVDCRVPGRLPESTKVVMSYYHIADLRNRIVQGPNFKDWKWVSSLGGLETVSGQQLASDWFPVAEDRIDRNDPDCVWRWRRRVKNTPILEMWSPVRWVLQLFHLQVPTRVGQARMVDSGEADTWVFQHGEFVLNDGPLKRGGIRSPHHQGVFRRPSEYDKAQGAQVYLFFNSNKTADIRKTGPEKGYVCQWPPMKELAEDPYYWLEKLREWQIKYNPIDRLVAWRELTGDKKLSVQPLEQLAEYPDTAFLFRTPETGEPHEPIGHNVSKLTWKKLLTAYQAVLLKEGIRHSSGKPIELINPETGMPWSSPHATRVSLITHLVLDGRVPVEIMMKIVGHSHLLMTIYYTKVGASQIQDAIREGTEKLNSIKCETLERDLLDTDADHIRDKVVFNASDWKTVLPINPLDRTPLGWLHLHDGICLAGGNSEIESQPGCHNGGPLIVSGTENKKPRHGPVPGGVRNCSRCRWKCAGKAHVPAMAATLNNRSYHLHRASATAAYSGDRDR